VRGAELANFRVTVSESGHDRYSAPAGQHDDVLMALCLGLWRFEHARLTARIAPSVSRRAADELACGHLPEGGELEAAVAPRANLHQGRSA
jgi:hypothetical protein